MERVTTTPSGRDKWGWYEAHDDHIAQATCSSASVVHIGDSLVAGLSRYQSVWKAYFAPFNALCFGLGGDYTQNVLWRAQKLALPETAQFAVIHCGTNNVSCKDAPVDIANGVLSVGLAMQERKSGLKIIVTGLLPQNLEHSCQTDKIRLTNELVERRCSKLKKNYYMEQDSDWTSQDGSLNMQYYYKDGLHLIEAGDRKLAASIVTMVRNIKTEEKNTKSEESVILASSTSPTFSTKDFPPLQSQINTCLPPYHPHHFTNTHRADQSTYHAQYEFAIGEFEYLGSGYNGETNSLSNLPPPPTPREAAKPLWKKHHSFHLEAEAFPPLPLPINSPSTQCIYSSNSSTSSPSSSSSSASYYSSYFYTHSFYSNS